MHCNFDHTNRFYLLSIIKKDDKDEFDYYFKNFGRLNTHFYENHGFYYIFVKYSSLSDEEREIPILIDSECADIHIPKNREITVNYDEYFIQEL